jgi:hypothetical protein
MGFYAEPPADYGSYAQPPEVGYYAAPADGYGDYGYYAEPPEFAEYDEPPEFAEYADPVAYYAEEYPGIAGYAEMPEMVGYGQYEPLAEDWPGVAGYAEPDYSGYVREAPPAYNPGCPMPTNVSGFAEAQPLEGYVQPGTVNPIVEQFTPQPGPSPSVPDTFRPLW